MTKFSNYLNEKVSKKEIDSVLSNDNILIGVEYEFVFDELRAKIFKIGGDFNTAWDEWIRVERQLDEWKHMVMNYALDQEKSKKKWEQKRLELWELEGLYSEMEISFPKLKGDDADDIKSQMKKMDKEISRLLGEIDNLKKEIDQYNSTIFQIEEEVRNMEIPPIYKQYMKSTGQSIDFNPERFSLTEPEDENIDSDVWKDVIFELFHKYKNDTPFKTKFRMGSYHGVQLKVGDSSWAIEPDQSIQDSGGVEIISPPQPLSEALDNMKQMFKFINRHGNTTRNTGLHINMSIKGVNHLIDALDPVKLVLFLDEGYIYNFFDERKMSSYAMSSKSMAIGQQVITPESLYKLIDTKRLTNFVEEKYQGINFKNLGKNYIEFRYLGGVDYHKKFNEIQKIVAHYGYNLSLACDPSFKYKEYVLKLQRVGNDIQCKNNWAFIEMLDRIEKNYKNLVADGVIAVNDIKNVESAIKKEIKAFKNKYGWCKNKKPENDYSIVIVDRMLVQWLSKIGITVINYKIWSNKIRFGL